MIEIGCTTENVQITGNSITSQDCGAEGLGNVNGTGVFSAIPSNGRDESLYRYLIGATAPPRGSLKTMISMEAVWVPSASSMKLHHL